MKVKEFKNKKHLIKFINSNDEFWNLVEFINWNELTDFGRNQNHFQYIDSAKYRLKKYIQIKLRWYKINKIRNNNLDIINENEIIKYYEETYKIILKSTYNIFLKDFMSGKLNIGDDSYWDLRSSIIGYGKDFLLNCLENKRIVIDIAVNRNFRENFGYIFQKV